LRVLVDEDFFDCGSFRPMLGDDVLKLVAKLGKALRKSFGRPCFQLAVGDMRKTVAVGANDPPARGPQPGVQAEDEGQASFSSSSSGTS
jgi:hypothetical protein